MITPNTSTDVRTCVLAVLYIVHSLRLFQFHRPQIHRRAGPSTYSRLCSSGVAVVKKQKKKPESLLTPSYL